MTTSDSTGTTRQIGAMTLRLLSDVEIELTREFKAPRRLVFDVYTKPEHVRRWWGPKGSKMIGCEMDVRPGGRWRYVFVKPNGEEYAFRGEYREVVPPERLVHTFEFEGLPGAVSVEAASFVERDGKTTVVAVSTFDSKAARDAMIASGMEGGAAETLDRLEELLQTMVE